MKVVYEIINDRNDKVIHVGETCDMDRRIKEHISENGKFYEQRNYISFFIVKTFDNKKDAFNYQCELQKKYGLETDIEKSSKNMKQVQKITTERKRIPIAQYDLNGNFIKKYPSILAAEKELKIRTIWNVVNGHQKSTKNFVFKPLENL
jgi:predicted GIY-YIG superfamily endonuclease